MNSDANLDSEEKLYRDVVDALVGECRTGQGQIAARRVRSSVWNGSATSAEMPEQHAVNLLLRELSPEQRETIAQMMSQQFAAGVHQALVTLHEHGVVPFDAAYEGTPFHDFVGRLDDWEWPEPGTRMR